MLKGYKDTFTYLSEFAPLLNELLTFTGRGFDFFILIDGLPGASEGKSAAVYEYFCLYVKPVN